MEQKIKKSGDPPNSACANAGDSLACDQINGTPTRFYGNVYVLGIAFFVIFTDVSIITPILYLHL
jgi:hypothetical protein